MTIITTRSDHEGGTCSAKPFVSYHQVSKAVSEGDLIKLKELLPHYAIDLRDNDNVFFEAIRSELPNSIEMVDAILDAGYDIRRTSYSGQTSAMQAPSVQMLRHLHKRGANLNARCPMGDCAIHMRCKRCLIPRNRDMARTLLELGVDPDSRDVSGNTPLMHLVNFGAKSLFSASAKERQGLLNELKALMADLIEAGADIHARNNRGSTALTSIDPRKSGHDTGLMECLLDFGARFDKGSCQVEHAAVMAIRNDNMQLLRRLFDHDLSPSSSNAQEVFVAALGHDEPRFCLELLQRGWTISDSEIDALQEDRPAHISVIRSFMVAQSARGVIEEIASAEANTPCSARSHP